MNVERYEFGCIKIDGHNYTTDVIIFPDRVRDGWWRKEGHSLHREDLDEILETTPEILVIGTGYYGNLQVPSKVMAFLRSRGIEIHTAPTSEAVRVFSELQRQCGRVVAALHLTC